MKGLSFVDGLLLVVAGVVVGGLLLVPLVLARLGPDRARRPTQQDRDAHDLIHHRLWDWRTSACPDWCRWPPFPQHSALPAGGRKVVGRIGPGGRAG